MNKMNNTTNSNNEMNTNLNNSINTSIATPNEEYKALKKRCVTLSIIGIVAVTAIMHIIKHYMGDQQEMYSLIKAFFTFPFLFMLDIDIFKNNKAYIFAVIIVAVLQFAFMFFDMAALPAALGVVLSAIPTYFIGKRFIR